MFTKILLALVVVCVVQASVFADNVFDDDAEQKPSNLEDLVPQIDNEPETEVARNPFKCDDAKCNTKCKDKGLPRGGCYLGRCKCRPT